MSSSVCNVLTHSLGLEITTVPNQFKINLLALFSCVGFSEQTLFYTTRKKSIGDNEYFALW